jgi:hypothetical protein
MFVPFPEKLAEVCKKVEDGLFDESKTKRIFYNKVHQGQINANQEIKGVWLQERTLYGQLWMQEEETQLPQWVCMQW